MPRAIDEDSEMTPSESSSSPGPEEVFTPSGPMCTYGDRLAFTYFQPPIPHPVQLNSMQNEAFWFSIDSQLVYLSFFRDTGPLHVGNMYRFCLHVHSLLHDESLQDRRIILYSSSESDKKANAALLMSLYAMVVLRWSPADAMHPICELEFQPFRDAGYSRADFALSIQDVVYGIRKAIDCRLLRLDEFDLKEYETFEKVENGDWNFITPRIIAFASPVETNYHEGGTNKHDITRLSKGFLNVLEHFEKDGVKMVIRLNKKLYNSRHFVERGLEHREMYFDDGTNPTMDMCREFIDICEHVISTGGAVAVHCKAGLGRTGTLIGAYLIYKHGFTACEAIGFMRFMRPGMCVGPQQQFLYENQHTWVRWAARDACLKETRPSTPPGAAVNRTTTPSTPANPKTAASATVPGQPRKTPGRTKHGIAAPEQPDSENTNMAQSSSNEATPRNNTQRPGGGRIPTKVKARQRPLSAMADNRLVDRLNLDSNCPREPRTKPRVKSGVFEAAPQPKSGPASPEKDAPAYNLRRKDANNTLPSPSRLPTRVSTRRTGKSPPQPSLPNPPTKRSSRRRSSISVVE